MTKKYLIFAGLFYYPNGGWEDFQGSFRSIDEAKAAFNEDSDFNWAHIVDVDTGKIILTNTPGLNHLPSEWKAPKGTQDENQS